MKDSYLKKNGEELFQKSNAMIIKETGYHYKTFKNRIIDILKKPSRLFKPIALFTFVLKERNDIK